MNKFVNDLFFSKKTGAFSFLKKWLPIVISLAAVIAVISFFTWKFITDQQTAPLRNIGQTFVKYLNNGDLDPAYELTTKEMRSQISKEQFVGALNDLKADHPKYSDEEAKISKDDKNAATYEVAVDGLSNTTNGKTKGMFELSLKFEDNAWRVATVDAKQR